MISHFFLSEILYNSSKFNILFMKLSVYPYNISLFSAIAYYSLKLNIPFIILNSLAEF